jgi:hypothetical protein
VDQLRSILLYRCWASRRVDPSIRLEKLVSTVVGGDHPPVNPEDHDGPAGTSGGIRGVDRHRGSAPPTGEPAAFAAGPSVDSGSGRMSRVLAVVAALALTLIAPGATALAAPALPRVAITATGLAVSGMPFTPRGANYVRLAGEDHITFEPGEYDEARALAVARDLRSSGHNTFRVMVDQGAFGQRRGIGGGVMDAVPFREDYLANLTSYISKVNAMGGYVIPVLSLIPTNCYFYAMVWDHGRCDATVPTANVAGYNAFIMDPGFVRAKAEYVRLFAAEMVARLGSTSGILAYESDNEANVEADQAPFATRSGSVTTVTGKTYSMSSLTQRQAAADESAAEYAVRVKAGLVAGDPDAKLMMGAFTNYAVGKSGFDGMAYCSGSPPCKAHTDWRYPVRLSRVLAVDVYDVHVYPRGGSYTVASDLKTAETSLLKRPYVIGELGTFTSDYATVSDAAYAMRDTIISLCKHGAKGYLVWTADTTEQPTLYTLLQNGGAINGQVAPVVLPDPCAR